MPPVHPAGSPHSGAAPLLARGSDACPASGAPLRNPKSWASAGTCGPPGPAAGPCSSARALPGTSFDAAAGLPRSALAGSVVASRRSNGPACERLALGPRWRVGVSGGAAAGEAPLGRCPSSGSVPRSEGDCGGGPHVRSAASQSSPPAHANSIVLYSSCDIGVPAGVARAHVMLRRSTGCSLPVRRTVNIVRSIRDNKALIQTGTVAICTTTSPTPGR